MNQIKFRAWHFKLQRMFSAEEMTNDQLALLPNGFFANISSTSTKLSRIYSHEEMLPLQYTGFKDKNGNEIYKGDLISEDGSSPYEVIWQLHSGGWIMQSFNEGRYYREMAYDYAQSRYEIVGNIYENPELISSQETVNSITQ